jgi:hypothetical protein
MASDGPAPLSSVSLLLADASLQLLEERSQARTRLGALLPALHTLLADARRQAGSSSGAGGGPSSSAVEAVSRWVDSLERDLAETHAGGGGANANTNTNTNTNTASTAAAATATDLPAAGVHSGWMRKMSATGLTSKTRWAVLDQRAGTLLYFTDKSETEVKGILQLGGAGVVCRPLPPSRVPLGGRGAWSFEIAYSSGAQGPGVGAGAGDGAAVAPSSGAAAPDAADRRDSSATDSTADLDPSSSGGLLSTSASAPALHPSASGSSAGVTAGRRHSLSLDTSSAAHAAGAGHHAPSVSDSAPHHHHHHHPSSSAATLERTPSKGGGGLGALFGLGSSFKGRAGGATHPAPAAALPVPPPPPAALNPLHASKSSYVWICQSEEERDAWVAAVRAASGGAGAAGREARAHAVCLAWGQRFAGATTVEEYAAVLADLCAAQEEAAGTGASSSSAGLPNPVLTVSAEWVRLHMAVAASRMEGGSGGHGGGGGGGGSGGSSGAGGADFSSLGALLAASETAGVGGLALSSPTATAAAPGLAIATPRNKKLAKALAGRTREVRGTAEAARKAAAAGDGPKAAALAAAAERAEASQEAFCHLVASAEASAQRRRAGFAPGDRASLKQLTKDYAREVVEIATDNAGGAGGEAPPPPPPPERLSAASAGELVAALARRLALALGGGDGARAASPSHRRVHSLEARIVAFARDILASSSRTVAGGDAYDALELAFRNPDAVLLVADSTAVTPLRIVVEGGTATTRVVVAQRYRVIAMDEMDGDGGMPLVPLSGGGGGGGSSSDLGWVSAVFERRFLWDSPTPGATVSLAFVPLVRLPRR